jgi:DNA-binding winged helix-turn-helix (wHTH) protein
VAIALLFAEFVFDEDRRQLFRGSAPLHLEPKAFQLLGLLLSRRPKAVSKAEIHEAIWPGAYISESSLPGLVGDLRAALGDNASEPRFIRTVLRHGYAFCGETALGGVSPLDDNPRWAALWAGREIPLPNGEHLIGRGEDCRIRSHSRRVSRHHARVRVTPEHVFVEDLGSRNGTWVHDRRIEGASELTAGDTVRVGPEVIQFVAARPSALTTQD